MTDAWGILVEDTVAGKGCPDTIHFFPTVLMTLFPEKEAYVVGGEWLL